MKSTEEKDSKKIYNILKKSEDSITYEESANIDQQSKLSVIRKIQENMTLKVKNNKELPTFRNLIPILSDISVLTQAYTNLYKKKGATTTPPGQNLPSVDGTNIERIHKLSIQIKNGTYTPSPVSQIMIPKPGKTKKRPLGIPSFDDKIVSEAMRMILNSIYDPLFEQLNVNHGFRPNRSPHTAVHDFQSKTQGLDITINGDVDAAYPSVNHKILITILGERIHDCKFLDLIWKFCRAGLFNLESNKLEQTLLGVPQGQIASPIIFNIYFHKFDEYVINLLNSKIQQLNETRKIKTTLSPSKVARGRTTQAIPSKAYNTINNNIYRANKRLTALNNKNFSIPFKEWTDEEKKLHNTLTTQISTKTAERSKLKYSDNTQIQLRYHYKRYADDWIIFLNCNLEVAENIKIELANYLTDTLKMSLSLEKTKIINITKEPTRFLGFSIGIYTKTQSTTIGNKFYINPDFNRIIERLHLKSHCDPDGFPRESPRLSTQNVDTIISEINAILEGLINYYYPVIKTVSQLQRISYILQYSCYKTLAQKLKTSVRKIIQICGGPKNPQYPITIDGVTKYYRIFDYNWLATNRANLTERRKQFQYSKINANYSFEIDTDFLTRTKANWRTRRTLLYARCILCGSSNHIQSHHIRSVRSLDNKLKKSNNNRKMTLEFKYIMQLLNRKQVPLCRTHHEQVTHNKLEPKYMNCSISELYDIVTENQTNQ